MDRFSSHFEDRFRGKGGYSSIHRYTVSESLVSLCVGCNDIIAYIAERISFAEHGQLVAESSEFHLMLSRAHKAHISNSKYAKEKRDILSEKRESGTALKKRAFTPESGTVDTYVLHTGHYAAPP